MTPMTTARAGLLFSMVWCFAGCGDDSQPQAECGNGVVEAGEMCDDGLANSDVSPDACRSDCQPAGCGDGVVDSGESCDGSDLAGADCSSAAGLPDGVLGCTPSCDFDTTGCFECGQECAPDGQAVLDCDGQVITTCAAGQACNPVTTTCDSACDVADANASTVGCAFYAVDMEAQMPDACFVVALVNDANTAAQISVERGGAVLSAVDFAAFPVGFGPTLSYQPYNEVAGLPPGETVLLFLSGASGVCPIPPAVSGDAGRAGTGIGQAFGILTDVPVSAYQINAYGTGISGITGSSLLLPTAAWGTNYLAVNAYGDDIASPSMNIVALADDTTVTIRPAAAVAGGGGVPASPANVTFSFTLQRGEHAQLTQPDELTGSVIGADQPVGVFAGQPCLRIPSGVGYCDHAEQMLPPITALGHQHVGVMYRPRAGEPALWRLVGVVDNTTLTWSVDVGGTATLGRGQVAELVTAEPFQVESQDAEHPFLLFGYMSGSQWPQLSDLGGYGDPEMVLSVPPGQFLRRYALYTLPNYPETNLVLVRAAEGGQFHDVTLDCLGTVTGWQPVGSFEWARVDLSAGDFQAVGNCAPGTHTLWSDAPFGVWVWGWGSPLTSTFTQSTSYGYPAGMGLADLSAVVVTP